MHICFGSLLNYLKADAAGFPPWNISVLQRKPQCCALSHLPQAEVMITQSSWEAVNEMQNVSNSMEETSPDSAISLRPISFGTFIPKPSQQMFIHTEVS